MIKRALLVSVFLLSLIALPARADGDERDPSAVFVSPASRSIRYTGRIDFSDPEAPRLLWSGSSFSFVADTTRLRLKLEDAMGANRYAICVDGRFENAALLEVLKGTNVYEVLTGLAPGKHSFEVVKRTEIGFRGSRLLGINIDDHQKLGSAPPQAEIKIEFYGDSITSGSGLEDESRKDNGNPKYQNNILSYAAVTARRLGAEYHCISKSGIALTGARSPNPAMFDLYDTLDPYSVPPLRWDFAKWIPSLVVVNLFQNDLGLGREQGHPEFTKEAGSPQGMVEQYKNFLKKLRVHYPQARIVCVLGNMNVVGRGRDGSYQFPHPDYIRQAVDLRRQENDQRVYALIFESKNTPAHPNAQEHLAMADVLTPFLGSLLSNKAAP